MRYQRNDHSPKYYAKVPYTQVSQLSIGTSLQVHVSNLNGLSEELEVDICDQNNSTFSTLEIKLENNSITVTSGSSRTLPTASMDEMVTVSIGSAPGRLVQYDGHSAILL